MIKIAFDDFWPGFNKEDNFFTRELRKNFEIEVVDTSSLSYDELADTNIQFLFYSCYGKRYLYYDCIKIYFTGECIVPNFNECDYAIGFDHINFGDRYFRYPLYMAYYKDDVDSMMKKNNLPISVDKKFCGMVVSNNFCANPVRTEFFQKLSEYKRVDSGGKYLNNIGQPDGVKDKMNFLRDYKFSLAFENNKHSGYCTEKIVQAFAAGTIPIYWGDPQITDYFNEKAFVIVDENDIPGSIERIKEIDENDELFLSMRKEAAIIKSDETESEYAMRFSKWINSIFEQSLTSLRRRDSFGYYTVISKDSKLENEVVEKYIDFEKAIPHNCISGIKRKIKLLLQ